MLALNGWSKSYKKIQLGGLTCDSQDYYNSEKHIYQTFLPERRPADAQPLYVGFFHTGAYQESLSGYGGIKHCLIPAPQHIILDRAAAGLVLSLGACNRQKCPAYSSTKEANRISSPITASAATPAARQ